MLHKVNKILAFSSFMFIFFIGGEISVFCSCALELEYLAESGDEKGFSTLLLNYRNQFNKAYNEIMALQPNTPVVPNRLAYSKALLQSCLVN